MALQQYQLLINDRISLPAADGWDHFVVSECSRDGYILRHETTSQAIPFTFDDLANGFINKSILHRAGYYTQSGTSLRVSVCANHLSELPKKEVKEIFRRLEYCKIFSRLKSSASGRTYTDDQIMEWVKTEFERHSKLTSEAQKTLRPQKISRSGNTGQRKTTTGQSDEKLPHPTAETVVEWCDRLAIAAGNPLALRDLRHCRSGNRKPRYHVELIEIVDKYAHIACSELASGKRTLLKDLEYEISQCAHNYPQERQDAEGIFKVPSIKFLNSRIELQSAYQTFAAKFGKKEARNFFRAIGSGANYKPMWPLELVEQDAWTVHLHTLVDRSLIEKLPQSIRDELTTTRVTFQGALDRATECFVGLDFDFTENVDSALRCYRSIMTDKNFLAQEVGAHHSYHMSGRTTCTVTDNKYPEAYKQAVEKCGSAYIAGVVGVPWLRSRVENVFRHIINELVSNFTGQTGSNAFERRGYEAEGRASVSVKEFTRAALRWIIDVYHYSPLKSLGGESPAARWDMLTQLARPAPPIDAELARAIFGNEVELTLDNHGLRYQSEVAYNSNLLMDIFQDRGRGVVLRVKVDPMDIGRASFFWNGEWHVAPAHHDYSGMSLQQLKDMRARIAAHTAAGELANAAVRAEALKYVRNISQSAMERAGFYTRFTEEEIEIEKSITRIGFNMLDKPPDKRNSNEILSEIIDSTPHDGKEDFVEKKSQILYSAKRNVEQAKLEQIDGEPVGNPGAEPSGKPHMFWVPKRP